MLQILTALDRNQYDPYVVVPSKGALTIALEKEKIGFLIDHRIRPYLDLTSTTCPLNDFGNLSGLLNYHAAIKAAHEQVRCIKPDLVHINSSGLIHLSMGVRKSGRIPTIVHLRENWELRSNDFRVRLKDRILRSGIDEVVSISRVAAERFVPGTKYSYVPDWVDFNDRNNDINLRELYGISAGARIILAPSSRSWIKGADVAVNAIRLLDLPSAVLVVLGARGQTDKNIKKNVKRILRLIKLESFGMRLDRIAAESNLRAILTPPILEVRSAIEQSAMVISPFIFPHSSKAIIEAGACGRPVIASDNLYNREVLIDGMTGFFVPTGDAASLADAILRLLNDPPLCRRIGLAGRKHVEECFSRVKSLKSIFSLYETMTT